MTRAEPRSGQLYRHFKGAIYRIITVGHHSETGEKMARDFRTKRGIEKC